MKKANRKLSVAEALVLLAVSVAILMWGVLRAGTPTAVSLLISGAVCALYGNVVLKQKFDDIFDHTMKIVSGAMPALYFLMFTGAVSAVWIASGTIPYIVCVGLGVIKPQIFLFAALLITALTSLCTGSSWAIIASVGLALAGIGQGLGVPPALTAGCIVSGCFMGDKWSPLSDSCNLVAATSGQKSVDVSKSMCATSGGALVISLLLYLIIGLKYSSNADISQITEYISQLNASFHMSFLLLLPLVFVIVMVVLKFPILPVLFGGVVIGAAEAMIFQGQTLTQMLNACWSGYVCDSGFDFVDTLFTRGGIVGTADLIMLFFAAVFFAGSAESIGIIDVIAELLTKVIHGAGSLVAATAATCIGIVFLTSSDYTSIILNNRLYGETYKKIGVDGIVLSRTVAESTTTIGAVCPWNSSAMVASAAVGVSAFAYAPLCFPTWIAIILAIVYAFAGKFTPRAQKETAE